MSIKILSESEIKQQKTNSYEAPAILFANPKNLYQRRVKRLRELADSHPLSDYLLFAADIVETQLNTLEKNPLPKQTLENLTGVEPLNAKNFKRDGIWREYLNEILYAIKPKANEQVSATIEMLEKASTTELEEVATHLLSQEFHLVSADKAVFVWAALSLYWLQLAQQIPHHSRLENAENLHHCPVCGSLPVSSMVHIGTSQGLRYLHCSLCESEWNLVRAQCTNCDGHDKLETWSLDEELALIRAETCGSCESYLKIMFQEKNPNVESIADDLASIFLDVEMEEKGFARSGINPFFFPAQEA
ncbi:formate dehydrogenase accessory protein FdhE [Rodentibacter trehalosifermentans]|uniref:Protein FdhE homolog n=1 Tax=Rodentibacter trehalosifermentans TaxID=1908263 RepID=A0A1V3IYS7_9PAST|nr:formate dehydrogenase accessory protein FdhE [Rodentibacter trehalosifermentans]OOF47188.1 formate dehydrogenase accessory protein FdhE [Rodentibacter trehalosifermentans]OOF49488.1 formate dehydrogenase accessory protein FdhE [Rodentibacter trehalosifermentans]OOF52471.1 formate dehydrogenase accessory protein FdhE [Rodentibacter trehalosifermentans]